MKHIWYVEESTYDLNEGYVKEIIDTRTFVYPEDQLSPKPKYIYSAHIFEDRDKAVAFYKNKLKKQINITQEKIDVLEEHRSILVNKLLSI